jgi:hypothetical protein
MPSLSPFIAIVLALFAVVGHACELPIGAALAAIGHHHGEDVSHHDAHDHHAGESQVSCDAVVGVHQNSCVYHDRDLVVVAGSVPGDSTVAVRVVAAALPESDAVPRRQPLYVLYASLLI